MSAIVCPACNRSNDPWRRHCGGCGSHLPGGCPACGAVNRIDDRFCGGCGQHVRATMTQASTPKKKPGNVHATQTIPIDLSELLPELKKQS